MPTYEFRCPEGHVFDRFYRKMSDAVSELPCPVCGKLASRQLSGGAGLVFKGSGFYLTDYGKNAHRGESGSKAKSASSTSDSSSETKSAESKAESKSTEPKSSDGSSSTSSEAKSTASKSTSTSGPKSDK